MAGSDQSEASGTPSDQASKKAIGSAVKSLKVEKEGWQYPPDSPECKAWVKEVEQASKDSKAHDKAKKKEHITIQPTKK